MKALQKGQYLAPRYDTYSTGLLLVGVTHYDHPVETGFWHHHEKSMVSMVLRGENLESRESRQILRKNGSLNFYHAYEPHKNDYREFPAVHLSLEVEADFLSMHQLSEADLAELVKSQFHLQASLVRMWYEASEQVFVNKTAIEAELLGLFSDQMNHKQVGKPQWVGKVREQLNENWQENPSLEALAQTAQVHPITISKYFKRYFGCTLGTYMRRHKIKHALSMLAAQQYSLTEIAFYCGFADQSHFNRVFKHFTGLAPGAAIKSLALRG